MRAPLLMLFTAVLAFGCYDRSNLLTSNDWTLVRRFTVRTESGEQLWEVRTHAPRSVCRIDYGKIPAEFQQTYPTRGLSPRLFTRGERLVIDYETDRSTVIHHVEVTSTALINPGDYIVVPRSDQK